MRSGKAQNPITWVICIYIVKSKRKIEMKNFDSVAYLWALKIGQKLCSIMSVKVIFQCEI